MVGKKPISNIHTNGCISYSDDKVHYHWWKISMESFLSLRFCFLDIRYLRCIHCLCLFLCDSLDPCCWSLIQVQHICSALIMIFVNNFDLIFSLFFIDFKAILYSYYSVLMIIFFFILLCSIFRIKCHFSIMKRLDSLVDCINIIILIWI